MKETHVIVEYKKEDFEQKLNRFINNGWNIINSNLIRPNGFIYTDKNATWQDLIVPNIDKMSKTIYYALLMKED